MGLLPLGMTTVSSPAAGTSGTLYPRTGERSTEVPTGAAYWAPPSASSAAGSGARRLAAVATTPRIAAITATAIAA